MKAQCYDCKRHSHYEATLAPKWAFIFIPDLTDIHAKTGKWVPICPECDKIITDKPKTEPAVSNWRKTAKTEIEDE
jgi:hypothetical protein